MGNCCGVQVDLDETQEIQFNGKADRLIQNPYSPYKGTLVQDPERNGNKVFRTTNAGNPDATVLVYSYTSTPPVTGGTYVVLQFKESRLYFTCIRKGKCKVQLILKSGTEATEITSTADPRVFLMKPIGGTDLVFASCVASQQSPKDPSKARVITLLKNMNTPAVFRLKGNGPTLESQYFKIEDTSQGGAGEQSDECQFQEEQHRN